MDVNPIDVIEIFVPNRRFRKELNGSQCCMCHMRVHFLDVAVVKLPFGVKPIHQPCSALLIEAVQDAHDALEGADEDTLAALASTPEETA